MTVPPIPSAPLRCLAVGSRKVGRCYLPSFTLPLKREKGGIRGIVGINGLWWPCQPRTPWAEGQGYRRGTADGPVSLGGGTYSTTGPSPRKSTADSRLWAVKPDRQPNLGLYSRDIQNRYSDPETKILPRTNRFETGAETVLSPSGTTRPTWAGWPLGRTKHRRDCTLRRGRWHNAAGRWYTVLPCLSQWERHPGLMGQGWLLLGLRDGSRDVRTLEDSTGVQVEG